MTSDDPCAAATVCRPDIGHATVGNCFQVGEELYNRGYNILVDPEGNCEYVELSGDIDDGGYNTERPPYRYFAWGIGQIIESPWTYWPEEYNPDEMDGFYIDEWERAQTFGRGEALPTAKACAPPDGYFNPFNETHSICLSVASIAGDLNKSIGIAQSHNLGQGDFYKERVIGGFITAYKILGIWDAPSVSALGCGGRDLGDCLLYEYERHAADECVGDASSGCAPIDACELNYLGTACVAREDECYFETEGEDAKDFLWFTHCYFQSHDVTEDTYRGHYTGFRKIGRYAALVKECANSYCPSNKRLEEAYTEAGGILDDYDSTNPWGLLGED